MKTLKEILQSIEELSGRNMPLEYVSYKPTFKRIDGKLKKQGSVPYISWPHLCRILHKCTDSCWSWEVRTQFLGDRVVVEGKLTIHSADGVYIREATGYETLEVDSFGDSTSNAEAMAMRRACAKFGIGLHLWEKEDKNNQMEQESQMERTTSDSPQVVRSTLRPVTNNGGKTGGKKEITREEWLARQTNKQT